MVGWGGLYRHLAPVQVAGDAAARHFERSRIAPGAPASEASQKLVGGAADGVVEHEHRQAVGEFAQLDPLPPTEVIEPAYRVGSYAPDGFGPSDSSSALGHSRS